MYCSECRLTFNEDSRYCPSCGKSLNKSAGATIATRSDAASYPSSSSGKQYGSLSDEEMLQSFVGSNCHYYLDKWHSAASPQKRRGWNWVAFFFGPIWLAYRRMNRQLVIYYVVVIAGFISVSLLRLINLAASTDSSAIWLMAGLIAAALSLITLIMPFIFGMDANKWYYNHSQRHIRRLQSKSTDHQQLSLALTRTGGTSFLAAFFICILSTVLLIVWFVLDTAINGY